MGPRPQKEKVKGACGFCHHREQTLDSGVLYKTPDDEVAAHFNCMLFSPPLVSQCSPDFHSFGGFLLEDVKKEIKRGQRLRCNSCKKSGATVGCDVSRCKKSYHYACALKCNAHAIEDEQNGIYKILCARHRPDRVSNGDEHADDSSGILISTDEEVSLDGADDDGTWDDDLESETSLGCVESSNSKEVHNPQEEQAPAPSTQGNKTEILDTPKRNMLKRLKASTPQAPVPSAVGDEYSVVISEKVTNGSSRHLDFGGNAAVTGPLNVHSNPIKPEDADSVLCIDLTSGPKRKRLDCPDSSESPSSNFDNRPMKKSFGECSAVPSMADVSHVESLRIESKVQEDVFCPEPLIMERKVQVANLTQTIVDDQVKDSGPQWIKLLSQCYAQIKNPSDVNGQTNNLKGRDFWNLCSKENCIEALLKKMKASVETNIENILHQNASEEDYEQAFNVLKATGCLQNIAKEVKQEIKDKKEALEREKANLLQKEQMLDEILGE